MSSSGSGSGKTALRVLAWFSVLAMILSAVLLPHWPRGRATR